MKNPMPHSAEPTTPKHLAIIMDGNGRWARQRNLPRIAGHKKGADAVKEAIETCRELNIPYLTLYAFSSENWNRPADEVEGLMELLRFYLGRELKQLHENNIRLRVIGDRSPLSPEIRRQIEDAELLTRENHALHLTIALSYGSRQEILRATKAFAEDVVKEKQDLSKLDENIFSRYLYTTNLPDPDLLIRTSGEQRLSNFLLWQLAYTELVFIDILWPDFKKSHILEALSEFAKRERRYGVA